MQVLIPISSRSAFFPETEYYFPKPLITINGKPMIELVVKSIQKYIQEPKFIFVVDSEDCIRFSLDKLLMLLCGEKTVVVQKSSETKGALCSALLAIDHLEADEPLIISNCDTILEGGLNEPMRRLCAPDVDAAVFTFDSIHPRWSYVRADEDGNIAQVHEKEVISSNAIAGVYYFKKTLNFINAAMKCILDDISLDKKFFLSSTINQVILGGGRAIFEELPVSQVGTFYSPDAINEYLSLQKQDTSDIGLNIIIPAAGLGSRFKKVGWKKPKPFIEIDGKPMVSHVVENLRFEAASLSIILPEDLMKNYPTEIGALKNAGVDLIAIQNTTEGTACTILAAEEKINNNDMLLVANSDQLVDFDVADFVNDCISRKLDGSIVVFRDEDKDPKWSFAKTTDCGRVTRVAEKDPISDLATVGIYLFKSGASFVSGAVEMIVKNERVNGEFYTCPVYNYLINRGCNIGVYEVDRKNMHGLGTPNDLQEFIAKRGYLSSRDQP